MNNDAKFIRPADADRIISQKTKQTAGEQLVLFKRGIGIRDFTTVRGDDCFFYCSKLVFCLQEL